MKGNPHDFAELELQFVVNGQKSKKRTLVLTGELLSQGGFGFQWNQIKSDPTQHLRLDNLFLHVNALSTP